MCSKDKLIICDTHIFNDIYCKIKIIVKKLMHKILKQL